MGKKWLVFLQSKSKVKPLSLLNGFTGGGVTHFSPTFQSANAEKMPSMAAAVAASSPSTAWP